MNNNSLAIVIPAFKATFLGETLESISNQTRKDFMVYIGDDASPSDLQPIIEPYQQKINLIYKRFPENLGGTDLVAQWERCIDLVHDESWIWLFSDDDLMAPTCVETFYNTINAGSTYDVYHFNADMIDTDSKLLTRANDYPEVLSSGQFIQYKLKGNISSYVVEYIFNKKLFFSGGRFINFDLAWNSDDATWMKLAQKRGIKTIGGPRIGWRSGTENISRIQTHLPTVKRKLQADIRFTQWLQTNRINFKIKKRLYFSSMLTLWFLVRLHVHQAILGKHEAKRLLKEYAGTLKPKIIILPALLYFYAYKKYRL